MNVCVFFRGSGISWKLLGCYHVGIGIGLYRKFKIQAFYVCVMWLIKIFMWYTHQEGKKGSKLDRMNLIELKDT